jgi:hypothetical protein
MFWGVLLVLAGLIMLADEMGYIRGDIWDYLVPIILVAIGVKVIFGERSKKQT